MADDPPASPGLTSDPGDDYLVALARHAGADAIVSGDRHLLELPEAMPPVLAPRQFLEQLGGA
jgi:predicted nucleic acid-binding protein